MFIIIGLVVVFVSVFGGFAMVQGPFAVLIQPAELVVILGAALGATIIGAPLKMLKEVVKNLIGALKGSTITKATYVELLKLQYEIFINAKKGSWLALETDITTPESSSIFSKYPTFLANHHACEFLCGAISMFVNGAAGTEEIAAALDAEIETHEHEAEIVPGILNKTSDSLPGLGIVAAVLGIIVTMQHIDGEPAEIGHHVAAALVGTFLGLLFSYGILSPIATNIEKILHDEGRYLCCIKSGLIAFANGTAPATAAEFARRTIFSFDRPSPEEIDKEFREIRPR